VNIRMKLLLQCSKYKLLQHQWIVWPQRTQVRLSERILVQNRV
jgi:hypothetical protein